MGSDYVLINGEYAADGKRRFRNWCARVDGDVTTGRDEVKCTLEDGFVNIDRDNDTRFRLKGKGGTQMNGTVDMDDLYVDGRLLVAEDDERLVLDP